MISEHIYSRNFGTAIFDDFVNGSTPIPLILSRDLTAHINGAAVARLMSEKNQIRFAPIGLTSSERLAVNQSVLIWIGNPFEFNEADAARLLQEAGYPSVYLVSQTGDGPEATILDQTAEADRQVVATPREHVGFLFRALAPEMGREMLVFMGTTPLGVYAAVLWATSAAPNYIAIPAEHPNRPIEALIRVVGPIRPDGSLPALNDIKPDRLTCGELTYNFETQEWESPKRKIKIRVLTRYGKPEFIHIGSNVINVTLSDEHQLLWLLCRRTMDGVWTSMETAEQELNPDRTVNKQKTYMARITNIRALTRGFDLVLKQKAELGGRMGYKLNAEIEVEELKPNPRKQDD